MLTKFQDSTSKREIINKSSNIINKLTILFKVV